MKKIAVVHLKFSSEKQVQVLLKALLPETRKTVTSRSKVSVEGEGRKLVVRVEAEDVSALRAALNSYLRWVALVRDTYEAAVNLERTNECKNT